MNIATEIRLPMLRRKPMPTPFVRVYTTDAKPPAQPEPEPVAAPPMTETEYAAAWQALAQKEGHMPMIECATMAQIEHAKRYAALQTERCMAMLRLLTKGPCPRFMTIRHLGLNDGSYFNRMAGHAVAKGWMNADRANNGKVTYTITDAGRAWLAETAPPAIAQHKVAAE